MKDQRKRVFLFDRSANWQSDPGRLITSREELTALLRAAVEKSPQMYELDAFECGKLLVGLGGKYGCAQFIEVKEVQIPYDAKSLRPSAQDDVEFDLGGTSTPVAPEFCLTVEEVIHAAVWFFETGERDPKLTWDLSS